MKKLIAITLTTLSLVATASEERDKLEAILNEPDLAVAQKMMGKSRLFDKLKYSRRYKELRLEYDKKLADKGLCWNWWDSQSFPYLSANERIKYGLDKSLAGVVAICKKYKCNITPYGLIKMAKMTPDEAITVFNEFITRLDHIETNWLDVFTSYFAIYAAEKNLSDSFAAAMATPYYSGMNDWLKSIGATNKLIDISTIWTPESVAKLKADILAGEMPLTDSFAYRLKIALGVEEYNKFIDLYMEEK